jgi:hypothetical protein
MAAKCPVKYPGILRDASKQNLAEKVDASKLKT